MKTKIITNQSNGLDSVNGVVKWDINKVEGDGVNRPDVILNALVNDNTPFPEGVLTGRLKKIGSLSSYSKLTITCFLAAFRLYNTHGHKVRFPLKKKGAICDRPGYSRMKKIVKWMLLRGCLVDRCLSMNAVAYQNEESYGR